MSLTDHDRPSDSVAIWRMRALLFDYLDWAGSFHKQDGRQSRWEMIDLVSKALDIWEDIGKAAHIGPPQYTFDEIGAVAHLDATWCRVLSGDYPAASFHELPESSEVLHAAWIALDTFSVRGRYPPERLPELES